MYSLRDIKKGDIFYDPDNDRFLTVDYINDDEILCVCSDVEYDEYGNEFTTDIYTHWFTGRELSRFIRRTF